MLCILDRHDSMDSEYDGTMKRYKEKNHANPDPINIACSISLIHFFSSIIIANNQYTKYLFVPNFDPTISQPIESFKRK